MEGASQIYGKLVPMSFELSTFPCREIIKLAVQKLTNQTYKITPFIYVKSVCDAYIVYTVVPALGDHHRERPPAVCGHLINVPTHFNVKLPPISGHLPNADADSHLFVVSTCYNGHCKQMPRFRWSFQPKIAVAHPNLRLIVRSNFRPILQ